MAYEVDLNDKRLTAVKDEEKTELSNAEKQYTEWADDVYGKYEDLADKTTDWEKEQIRIQNEQTDFAIDKIEQDKAEAKKDYTKEQSGAYVDWQKQSNQYGVNAEQMASMGMTGTGYSESSQVRMYNAYQNRMAMARQSYQQIVADYNNAITEAKLQNSSLLAEIATKAQQQRLEYLLQGTMYRQELLDKLAARKTEIQTLYANKWKTVLDQINTEKAYELEENKYLLEKDKWDVEKAQLEAARIANQGGGSPKVSNNSNANRKYTTSNTNNAAIKEVQDKVNGKKNMPIDESSILALGYGKISAAYLDKLIQEGKVVEYVENGKIKFMRATPKNAVEKWFPNTMKNFGL